MDLILRTTVILAVAVVIATLCRRATPASRHFLWHVTILLVVAAPLLQPITPGIPLPTLREAVQAVPPSYVAQVSRPATSDTATMAGLKACATYEGEYDGACYASERSQLSLSAIWVAGSLITGAWFALGYLLSVWRAGHGRHASGAIELAARGVARDLGLKRVPEIRVSARVDGPLTVGVLQPLILLPETAARWSAERQRAVLAHELAHVRRADTRTQALAHLACALYWFNPLVWIAARALRRERERACDDAVIAIGVRPSSYAQDLLDIARVMSHGLAPTAGLAMARRSELEGRLLSLLTTDRRRRPARVTRWAISAVMTTCTVLALGSQAAAVEHAPDVTTVNPATATMRYDPQTGGEQYRADRDLIESLTAALDDRSQDIREKAAMGLAVRSSPEVVEPLLRALRDPDAQVREKAAAGLMLRRDPRVVDALLKAITDTDSQVREKVAIALGTCGDPRAIEALRTATRDADQQVREKAVMGLALLTSSPMGPIDRRDLESGLSWAINTLLRAVQ